MRLQTPVPTVAVHLGRSDLARLSIFVFLRTPIYRWVLLALGVFVFAKLSMSRGFPITAREVTVFLLTTLVFMLGTAAFMLLLSIGMLSLRSRQGNGTLGRHEYKIRDDGLFEVTSANETLTKWGGATSLHKTRGALVVQVTPGLFHVFPRRCFESDEAFENFWIAIQRLVPDEALKRA